MVTMRESTTMVTMIVRELPWFIIGTSIIAHCYYTFPIILLSIARYAGIYGHAASPCGFRVYYGYVCAWGILLFIVVSTSVHGTHWVRCTLASGDYFATSVFFNCLFHSNGRDTKIHVYIYTMHRRIIYHAQVIQVTNIITYHTKGYHRPVIVWAPTTQKVTIGQ